MEQVKDEIAAKLLRQFGDVVHAFVIETITTRVGHMKSTLTVDEHVLLEEHE